MTSQEAQSNERLAEHFDRLDTYNNGRLTRSEFSVFEVVEGAQSSPGSQPQGRPGQPQSPGMQQPRPGGVQQPHPEGRQP